MNLIDFTQFGGMPTVQAGGDPNDPNAITWNFGITALGNTVARSAVYDQAPQLRGKWDGTTSISHWLATQKVLGQFLRAQNQPRGTCVGRGCSGALNVLQCLQIVTGKQSAGYKNVSHAWCYAGARTRGGMLGGGDGAMGADAAMWCHEKGTLHQEEASDTNYYGQGSDDVAVRWGSRSGIPSGMLPPAADNPASEVAACTSAEMAADAIASGSVITIASNQGFTMTRDAEGVCRASGSWAHQMYLAAIIVTPSGKKVFGCGQSWGDNTPDGPQLPGCPDYVFGIEWNVADRMLSGRDSVAIHAFVGWASPVIPWIFV